MKLKAIGQFGFNVAGDTVQPGDIFEVDEHLGKMFIYQGRAVEVKEEEQHAPPPSQPETGDEDEHDEDEKHGRKRTKK